MSASRTRRWSVLIAIVLAVMTLGAFGLRSAGAWPWGATSDSSTAVNAVDMDKLFPPGPGRELVLDNCTSCHSFVPIVILQMDKDGWERNSQVHRDRVPSLTDEEFKTAYEYLRTHFNPKTPIPKLPRSLLDTWTAN